MELLSDKINILTTEYSQRYPRFDTVFFLPAMVVWKMTEYSRSASGTMPSRKLKTSVEVYKMIENDVIHYSIRAGGGKDLEMKRIFDGDPIMSLSGDFIRVDSFVLENLKVLLLTI